MDELLPQFWGEITKVFAIGVAGLLALLSKKIFGFLDKSKRHAETKRKLELVKLLAEVDEVTTGCSEYRRKELADAASHIAMSSSDVRDIISGNDAGRNIAPSPFSLWDMCAALLPTVMFLFMIISDGFGNIVKVSIYIVTSGALSFTLAKYVVCKHFRGAVSQFIVSFFGGLLVLIVSLFVLSALFGFFNLF